MLLAGCAPAGDAVGVTPVVGVEGAGAPLGETAAPDTGPDAAPDAGPDLGGTRVTGRGRPHRNAPAPGPGQVATSRTGWSAEALGGTYGESDDQVLSTSVVLPGSSTYLGGNHVDIRGTERTINLVEFRISSTASGWSESFLVQRPTNPGVQPAPLLVLWHKFGSSHFDAQVNTDFFEEADARGWYVVAPLSAATRHFGSAEAQMNTALVLDFVMTFYGQYIDAQRIYSVGFSMGGGASLAYAANHVDPNKAMFAAVVTHTGGGSLEYTYETSFDDDDSDDNIQFGLRLETPDILDFWFGGSPTDVRFEYDRHSVMRIDEFGTPDYAASMITNLVHVPIYTWYTVDDRNDRLLAQTQIIHNEFQSHYGGTVTLREEPGSAHTWNTLDEVAVLDWLEQFSLELPTSGNTLADEGGNWFYFRVEQDAPGAFTPFHWDVDTDTNTLTLNQTANLQRASVETTLAGLDMTAPLTVVTGSVDGTGDALRFFHVPAAPLDVTRDGVSVPNWTYDALTSSLTLDEQDGLGHTWVVTFP